MRDAEVRKHFAGMRRQVPSSRFGRTPGGSGRAGQPTAQNLKSVEVMNQLVRWNPFNELENVRRQMTTLLNGASRNGEVETSEVWSPVVDIFEDEHSYLFKVELPGVNKQEVDVQIESGVLTISGERKAEKEQKIRRVHRIERAYGAFTRSFGLPDDADPEKVNAAFKDGVLAVTIAKAEHAKPRKIEVSVA
jgi:HSP20 family protein